MVKLNVFCVSGPEIDSWMWGTSAGFLDTAAVLSKSHDYKLAGAIELAVLPYVCEVGE